MNTNTSPFTPPSTKQELETLLLRAAALEHVLLSAYLFTAYSLKQDFTEGGFKTPEEVGVAQTWSGAINGVAVQEMLHLALACNMISAIGGTPEFRKEELNFPITPTQMRDYFGYGGKAYLSLRAFSQNTIETYQWFEDYEHGSAFPGPAWNPKSAHCNASDFQATPLKGLESMNISSLVELYKAIAQGFVNLRNDNLFTGNQSKQVTDLEVTGLFNFPPAKVGSQDRPLLTPVLDAESALIAINTIVLQGEGDTTDWTSFMTPLCNSMGLDYANFPKIQSATHYEIFSAILGDPKAKPVAGIPSIKDYPNWPNFVRNVPDNPLISNPCNGDPVCSEHISIIQDPFAHDTAILFNNLYSTMIDLLIAGFSNVSNAPAQEPQQSDEDYFRVDTYAKATLIQTSIRSMVYLMAPLANALPQIAASQNIMPPLTAGASFVYNYNRTQPSWADLVYQLENLAIQSAKVAQYGTASTTEVWIKPSYLDVPVAPHKFPRYSMQQLLLDHLVPDLTFLADRLRSVEGNAPPVDAAGQAYPQHVCYGLNDCAGQDISGTATAAGNGQCATADPHVCSGQNHCAGQGGCGFSPSGLADADLQNHPGQNTNAGQVKNAQGYWMFNGNSDSACGSPIMPSIRNTYGHNTDPSDNRGGDSAIYAKAQGNVWEFARLLFEQKRQQEQQSNTAESDFVQRYRGDTE